MKKDLKHNIGMAVGMLDTVLNNKWKKQIKKERIKAGLKITKEYIEKAEQILETLKT